MSDDYADFDLEPLNGTAQENSGGFVALAVLAAAAGAGAALLLAPAAGTRTRKRVGQGLRNIRGEAAGTMAQLQREIRHGRHQVRREKQIIGLAGVLIGAGITALLTPTSGTATRKRLGGALGRIKVGAVDRIERLRQRPAEPTGETSAENEPVRSVEEPGRDPDSVF